MSRGILALICLLAFCGFARAGGWTDFGERVWVSEAGNHYVVVNEDRPKEARFYLHKQGDPRPFVRYLPPPFKAVIPRVEPHRTLKIRHLPWDVWVLSKSRRFLVHEEYGAMGRGTTLALMDLDTKVRWSRELADFKFDAAPFQESMSSVFWQAGWWVDEARGKAVIVARGCQVREVDLATGAITHGDPELVLETLRSGSSLMRRGAMDVCMDRNSKPKGWLKIVRGLRDDPKRPTLERLRAALAVHFDTSERTPDSLIAAALKEADNEEIRQEVLLSARLLLGRDAHIVHDAVLVRFPEWNTEFVAGVATDQAVRKFGLNAQHKPAVRAQALGALTTRYDASAIVFTRCIRELDEETAKLALNNVRSAYRAHVAKPLAEGLKSPGKNDALVAAFLADNPSRDYIEPLQNARERVSGNKKSAAAIDRALATCRKLPK